MPSSPTRSTASRRWPKAPSPKNPSFGATAPCYRFRGREPPFRSLFFATLGSGLGTWLALVALQIDVLTRTHSPIWISALLIADILPMLLVGLVAAPLVDRLSRRRLM